MVAKNAKQQTFNLIEPHVSKKKLNRATKTTILLGPASD
jgi:hypothetical protein